ncbi:nitroreductase [Streptomyces sp. NPDC012438]|uniref:nitroreductase n=1 Tax=Streptomyces sp. NPDC012438 TaxID=3364833 RepID=UPI0036EF52D8
MPHADPDHRALRIGCAAALSGPRAAAAHRGLSAEVRPLPGPGGPWHLADVRLEAAAEGDGEPAALRPALAERHTSRFPFTEEWIPDEILEGLRAAAVLEGCRPVVPGDGHAEAVMGLVHASGTFEAADTPVRSEIARRTRTGAADEDAGTEGIPPYALGPRQYDVTSPVRDFDAPRRVPGRGSARFGRDPRIALLGTAGDAAAGVAGGGAGAPPGPAPGHARRALHLPDVPAAGVARAPSPRAGPALHDGLRADGDPHGVRPPGAGPRRPVSEVLRSV